jgi:hypothetical protein
MKEGGRIEGVYNGNKIEMRKELMVLEKERFLNQG